MRTIDEAATEQREGVARRVLAVDGSHVARFATREVPLAIRIHDDVLADPHAFRYACRQQPVRDITVGTAVFRGIAEAPSNELIGWIVATYPQLTPTLTVIRQSPYGQAEPNFIHTDLDLGAWTGVLYLNPRPSEGDGTTFWRHRASGAEVSLAVTEAERAAESRVWREPDQWEPLTTVPAVFNRLVLFEAGCFHSRALRENVGPGDEPRLTQIVFGTGGA